MAARIIIIGGGPCGLIAAQTLAQAGCKVTIYDRMPNVGRKFLLAGRGGLNLTHSEPLPEFIKRYGEAKAWLAPMIEAFSPNDLQKWCEDLGQETFIGSSGRVFPRAMKAAPLLRAWLKRLTELGVEFKMHHHWEGFEGDAVLFRNEKNEQIKVNADATLLALGGASWPRLGSDGGWVKMLKEIGVDIAPLAPANCGFITHWSNYMSRFTGTPLKAINVTHKGISKQGEIMLTAQGCEGGAIYALSSSLRKTIEQETIATIEIDLRPLLSVEALTQKLGVLKARQSLSTYLKRAGFSAVAIALLHEVTASNTLKTYTPSMMATRLKSLPISFTAPCDITKAISTAGGIKHNAVTPELMLKNKPGVFVAGEMLDWEAPTGGYLLQACFSSGIKAAKGIIKLC
jgi:uncharacterized flavoprotein (TIGR03862 family)